MVNLKYQPHILMTDITSRCNSACSFCYRMQKDKYASIAQLPYKDMPFEIFKKAVDEVKKTDSVKYLGLCGHSGEPLMHPEYLKLAEYAFEQNFFQSIHINTNGSIDTNYELLVKYMTYINISMDAYDEKTYKKIHKGTDFSTVHSNILKMNELSLKYSGALISVKFTECNENSGQYNNFKEYWEKLGIQTIYRKTTAVVDVLENLADFESAKECTAHSSAITISIDGRVLPCYLDYKLTPSFGNIIEKSLEDIWNEPAFEVWRNSRMNNFCATCSGALRAKDFIQK